MKFHFVIVTPILSDVKSADKMGNVAALRSHSL